MQTRLFTPLGMKDTKFFLEPADVPRFTTYYERDEKGALKLGGAFGVEEVGHVVQTAWSARRGTSNAATGNLIRKRSAVVLCEDIF